MKEILKILKKYTLGIILIVILLVVQANCDLALPEYTSNIINIGIQQKGVEESVANAYTENTLNSIVALSNDASILDYFELIESDSDASLEYIDDYPYLKEGNIYVKKELSESETAELEEKIVVPQIALYMIKSSDELAGENVEITPEIIAGIMASEDGVAFQENYANFEELDSALLDQYAISSVIDEYTTLEVGLESRQMNYLFSTGIKMIALAFLIMAIIILSTYLSGRIASMFSRDLRSKIVSKVMSYSNSEFNQFSTSSLITRSTNDVQQIQMLFTMLLRIVLYAPIIGIGALVKVAGIKNEEIIKNTAQVAVNEKWSSEKMQLVAKIAESYPDLQKNEKAQKEVKDLLRANGVKSEKLIEKALRDVYKVQPKQPGNKDNDNVEKWK